MGEHFECALECEALMNAESRSQLRANGQRGARVHRGAEARKA